ncbi:MAG: hypothetical protein E6H08_18750 [Bacteroidetes bacterium]|nr:MAG: hypothetical protein E6H08_18750 [Bacteroidota bacterium]
MSDALFQNFSTVQSNEQPVPNTIAAAATITPLTLITFLTGTTQVVTINPPVTGQHMLVLIFTNGSPGAFTTAGNIKAAYQPIQNLPVVLFYDPVTALYWGFPGTLT